MQPGDFTYWKRHLQKKLSSNLLKNPLSGPANQAFCFKTPANRPLDSHDTSKKVPNPHWMCIPSDDLKLKISQNGLISCHLMRHFPQDIWTRTSWKKMYIFFLHCFFFLLFYGKTTSLPTFSNPLQKGKISSFDYGFSEKVSSWSSDKLIFSFAFMKS